MDVLFSSADQDEVGNYSYPNRFLDPVDLLGDLMLAKSQAAFELFEKNLNGPSPLVNGKHLSCCQFDEIGHQYFCVLGTHVTPSFAQNDGDITNMTKTSALSEYPKGLSAFIISQSGNPGSLKTSVRDVLNQIAEAFTVFHIPGPGNGKCKAPNPIPVQRVKLLHQLHVLSGSEARIGCNKHDSGPLGRLKSCQHLPEQLVFVSIGGMPFGQNNGEIHRDAIDIPLDHQDYKLNAKKESFMFACSALLRYRVLLAPFVFLAPVADNINHLVFRRREGLDSFLRTPVQKNMQAPIPGGEQAPKVPFTDVRRSGLGKSFQGSRAGKNHLHHNQPAENELMTMTKNGRQSLEETPNRIRQMSESDVFCHSFHDG